MSAPLVVNTRDGVCWTRRVVTSGGLALYAPESVKTCSEFVMATEAELAEHGIVGSAFALPMPVREEPQEDPVAAGRRVDLLSLMDERAASVVSPVLAGVLDEAERLRARVAELETEREKLVRWHGEDSEAITKLVARVERRRARLVALQNDALAMRGSLSPNGEDRKVPFPLGETLTPAVDWLIARVAELEAAQGTVYRASHDSIVMGLYTSREAARAHCETVLRREIGDTAGDLGWIPDDGSDGSAEELSIVGPGVDEDGVPYDTATGYVVTPLEVAAAYDPDGDE